MGDTNQRPGDNQSNQHTKLFTLILLQFGNSNSTYIKLYGYSCQ